MTDLDGTGRSPKEIKLTRPGSAAGKRRPEDQGSSAGSWCKLSGMASPTFLPCE